MSETPSSPHVKGIVFAVITALCWGVLAILLKNALKFSEPETIVSFRMIFAFILSLPLIYIKEPQSFKILKNPPWLLVLGSLGLAFNYLGYMKGISFSGAANAQIMIQSGPLLLMFLGFALYQESIKPSQIFCLILALIGFYFFFKDQLAFIPRDNLLTANFWILSAAFTWTLYSLVIRHFSRKGYGPMELNLVVFLVCSLVLSLNSNWLSILNFSFFEWFFLGLLGLNTLVAYGCFGAALKYAPASQVSVIITMNPILTLLIISFGSPYFDFIPSEPTSSLGYTGAVLVVLGICFSTLLGLKKPKKLANKKTS